MTPGVLECGCLWDGEVLSIERGCAASHEELGQVAYVRHQLSIAGVPFDNVTWHIDEPPSLRKWLWDH